MCVIKPIFQTQFWLNVLCIHREKKKKKKNIHERKDKHMKLLIIH